MSFDPTELLIREALADEASRAVDPQIVLAELRRGRTRTVRHRAPIVVAAAVVVAAVAAVVVSQVSHRDGPAVGSPVAATDQNVLLAGLDGFGNADSVVLAHIGRDGAAEAVSLPRDSWVDVPGCGMQKVSFAYPQGRSQADANEAGARKLTATVQNLTGAAVDHYAIVDMTSFDRLSTAVGGVPVCLSAPSSDPYSGAWFPAGHQTLTGPAALAFCGNGTACPAATSTGSSGCRRSWVPSFTRSSPGRHWPMVEPSPPCSKRCVTTCASTLVGTCSPSPHSCAEYARTASASQRCPSQTRKYGPQTAASGSNSSPTRCARSSGPSRPANRPSPHHPLPSAAAHFRPMTCPASTDSERENNIAALFLLTEARAAIVRGRWVPV
jgi:LCP family protein required for cell wall assembly